MEVEGEIRIFTRTCWGSGFRSLGFRAWGPGFGDPRMLSWLKVAPVAVSGQIG